MVDTKEIPIRDLPPELTNEVNEHIRLFSVTMLISDDDDSKAIPCAGTLCNIRKIKGIITARHVWEEVNRHKYLFIMLGKGPYVIETKLLDAFVPPIGNKFPNTDIKIPDIAIIKLPPSSGTHIEAVSRVFYSIDKRVEDKVIDFCLNPIGYFTLFGAPLELMDYEKKSVPSFIYSTYISEYMELEEWDYQIMGINLDENPEIPSSFEGMSGGGIWKVKFHVSENMDTYTINNKFYDIVLCGVNFYQTAQKGRQIVGHGPVSIYKCLYGFARKN